MKLDRTRNAKRNILSGVVLRLYSTLMPFFIRTCMTYYIGVEYLGMSSLFTSILQVLNLTELGVGSAMVYSMYKPIAEDDTETVCALMNLYRRYYRIIGSIIAVLGVAVIPFLPVLVKKDVPGDINIYVLYLLNLAGTVMTYWLFAYKNSLFQAHQRNDVVHKVHVVSTTVQYALQMAVLMLFRSYYAYTVVYLLTQALGNLIVSIAADRIYPQYKPSGTLEKSRTWEINKRIADLFTAKLGGVVVNSADTIVISAFLGLTVLAVYENYYFILKSILGFVAILFGASMAGIGNSLIVESEEKNYNDLKVFTFIISWVAGWCATCLLCLYQPFMKVWMGVDLMLSFELVICFCVYFYVYEINQLLCTFKDAAGMWSRDKFRPLTTALVNLGLNLLLVQYIGLFGILLSTVLATLLVGMPWLLHNLFTELFSIRQLASYLKNLVWYVLITACTAALTYWVCGFVVLEGIAGIAVKAVICCVVPNVVFLLVYFRKSEFRQTLRLADVMLGGKLQKILKKDFAG